MTIVSKNITPPDNIRIKRALISVFDKSGLVEMVKELVGYGVEIISTGGSAKALLEAGVAVVDVSQITDFPEIMDGRVKTLHPGVHGGLLGIRDDEGHRQAMEQNNIVGIDLLVGNLYPFEKTVAGGADYANCVENIDIGGPAMIRAGAKNHAYVSVITSPDDYAELLAVLKSNDGATTLNFRKTMAAKAFGVTACYDAAISNWFSKTLDIDVPVNRAIGGTLSQVMRYGENPHQNAGFYVSGDGRPGVATARQLQGKQLSYNNINDTDAAFELISEFDPELSAAVAIIKHANPCGVAAAGNLAMAYENALACDPVSAFGGIIALNRKIDADTANKMVQILTEVIIAPDASDEAKEIIAGKKNLRLLLTGALADANSPGITAKTVSGGLLVQSRDNGNIDDIELKTVTKRKPGPEELADLKFAFRVAKHVKSNAIIYVKDQATVGVGAGQMSRVDSSRIAARKAIDAAEAAGLENPLTIGSVVASDAFFPFADGLISAIEAGATAVIQPGGSMRDEEVIAAADEAGIAMVFTGMRHFRH
ncbi:MAG: bifunctional phosphoribosylaminoimidazolecarboxamide formyltransferase/IMP cyclohydrolase [Rhizobiaceae bacterium]|nr:bifunctional phosphoribosylaminoimidazolecarboxamide formyltransferase/IMP cyclohydrolase [Rhizobiaceae bacterium]